MPFFAQKESEAMDIYVARQPIYDASGEVRAYELLYRKNKHNAFEGIDDRQATASLIASSMLVMNFNELVDGKRGFINFSEEFLTDEIPKLFRPDKVVIEILERVHLTERVVNACQKLKASGYTLALDDFTFDSQIFTSGILKYIDIIKVEFPRSPLRDQLRLLSKYRGKISFLAEKIETEEQFKVAKRLGYTLFQGYLFSRPVLMNAQDIPALDQNVLQIIQELQKRDPNYFVLTKLFRTDMGLSYKLLRLANTVNYGSTFKVLSIHQALARIGIDELTKWMNLILLQNLESTGNAEFIKNSMIRAKMLEQIAWEIGRSANNYDFFLTGLFASLDVMMNKPMEQITAQLLLHSDVKDALNGKVNSIRLHLNAVLAFERADWDSVTAYLQQLGISKTRFTSTFLVALRWQQSLSAQASPPAQPFPHD